VRAPAPLRHSLSGLLIAAAVAATGAVDGGYFPPSWGWAALALLLAATATLIVADRVDFSTLDGIFFGALTAFVGWTGLSAVWSQSVPRSLLELERSLVYLAGAAALLLLARRGAARWLAGGVLAGAGGIATYALATRLFPDRFGYELDAGYQLARPVGYWNALGLLAALAIVLALGFAESARRDVRAVAAAALPLLALTLYFTFSRGALVALAAGLAAMTAVHPRRLRLAALTLALTPLCALGVALASRSQGLARASAPLDVAVREGHRLAAALVLLAAGSALVSAAFERLAARVTLAERVRRAIGLGLLAVAGGAVLAVVVAAGGPLALAGRGYDAFRAPLPPTGGELEGRLFSASGNGRVDYWRVALGAYADHPVLGSGAGTYELHWNRDRPTAFDARDAHSLYLETLAELGPVGVLLLLTALATPLLALPTARRRPLVAPAAGAYVAFVTHAALDWDWEFPAVTLAGLACGLALLIAARRPQDERALKPLVRGAGIAAAAAAGAFAFVAYVGNSAVAVSSDAAAEGRFVSAASEARRAMKWTPWASEPWRELAEAQLALGRARDARRSFREAISKDPRDWSLWYGVARASEGAERRSALRRARRLNPRSPDVVALEQG
jgi:tetratricopeptide (TPR) repeat protein